MKFQAHTGSSNVLENLWQHLCVPFKKETVTCQLYGIPSSLTVLTILCTFATFKTTVERETLNGFVSVLGITPLRHLVRVCVIHVYEIHKL